MADEKRRLTVEAWQLEGAAKYGPNVMLWKFRCPSCGMVQSGMDYRSWNANVREIDVRLAFSCIGRLISERNINLPVVDFMEKSVGYGCNYAGGGLFRVAPLEVVFGINGETGAEAIRPVFDWADPVPGSQA